jgi:CBS domain containing-hemolysin-like protein
MAASRQQRALVIDSRRPVTNQLVGIVTPTDIARMAEVSGLAGSR